jgi:poly(3-hydroxybutyrate) depolymerase
MEKTARRTGFQRPIARTGQWFRVLAAVLTLVGPARAASLDQDAAVKLGRQYLAAPSRALRQRLADRLADYQGDVERVLGKLSTQSHRSVKPGFHAAEHFAAGELRKKHPDDLLYFVVPEGYRPDRSTGLIVFLHGGGAHTSRKAPQATLRFPEPDTPRYSSRSGDLFAATGMITVGPSAPWNQHCYHRWCLPEADDYLADVILECKSRFNIDSDRVFLIGHSMGGFGAYQHAQRQPDRFAAVAVSSGSWSLGYWPAIRGTPLWIVQGAHDARPGVRWHYTDVEYGRWTDRILTREDLEHRYLEHDGHHGLGYGRKKIAQFLDSARTLRRDPHYPRVALATPAGFRPSCCFPVIHNRWLTLDKPVRGDIQYDELVAHGQGTFGSWRLEHLIGNRRGAAIEAINRGDNTIAVTTRNVARFTVWLHPRMVDLAKPVSIVIDGKVRFNQRVKPSLATALESFRRRSDWGLIYPIKIELSVPAEAER